VQHYVAFENSTLIAGSPVVEQNLLYQRHRSI